MNQQISVSTLSFIHNDQEILLALKKRGFGANLWNGFGGKVEKGESLIESAKREIFEESGIKATKLEKMAFLSFQIDTMRELLEVHVFNILEYSETPKETAEMRPKWFKLNDIPYSDMWVDDYIWLPKFLENKKIIGTFHFKNESEMLSYRIKETNSFF